MAQGSVAVRPASVAAFAVCVLLGLAAHFKGVLEGANRRLPDAGFALQRTQFPASRQMARCQLQAQHFLPRTRALSDTVVGGGRLQWGHHVIRIGDTAGQSGLAILFDEMTTSCQQPQDARNDLAQ